MIGETSSTIVEDDVPAGRSHPVTVIELCRAADLFERVHGLGPSVTT